MSNKSTLDLLAITFYYSTDKLKLTPITFRKGKNQQWVVTCITISNRTKYMWYLTLMLSFFMSISELYLSLYNSKSKKLTQVLYHTFQIIVKASVISVMFLFNFKSAEMKCFFNCICKRRSQAELLSRKKLSESKVSKFLAIYIAVSLFVFYLVLIPLASLAIPHFHETLFIKFLFSSYDSFFFKACVWTIQTISFIPASAIAPVGTTSSILALGEITLALKNLCFIAKVFKNFRTKTYIEYVCTLYREIQILVILSNKAFQTFYWPFIQFYGAMVLMSLLYPLILFMRQLGASGVCIICTMVLATGGTCCSMLSLGRQTIILSTKVLDHSKSWNGYRWSRKFFRSCPTIAICVGEFHKMDSERVPAFIRFILQRTFFLVLRTKLSLSSGNDVDIIF